MDIGIIGLGNIGSTRARSRKWKHNSPRPRWPRLCAKWRLPKKS